MKNMCQAVRLYRDSNSIHRFVCTLQDSEECLFFVEGGSKVCKYSKHWRVCECPEAREDSMLMTKLEEL